MPAGWEEEEAEEADWRGNGEADGATCCPGGTAVARMSCGTLRAWLLCIGYALSRSSSSSLSLCLSLSLSDGALGCCALGTRSLVLLKRAHVVTLRGRCARPLVFLYL